MPWPLEPVERAAFFGECTLAGLQEFINQPDYCMLADNAPQQIRDELCTQHAIHKKHDTIYTVLNNKRPDHVSDEKPAPRCNLFP